MNETVERLKWLQDGITNDKFDYKYSDKDLIEHLGTAIKALELLPTLLEALDETNDRFALHDIYSNYNYLIVKNRELIQKAKGVLEE